MNRYALAALVVCLSLVGAVACGDDDSGSQTEVPNQEVCASAADVRQAADALRGLDPANTTLTQLEAGASDLESAVSGLTAAASDASSADREAFASAADELRSAAQAAVQAIAAGGSPQQELAAVRDAAVPLEEAADALGPDCPDGGGTTTG